MYIVYTQSSADGDDHRGEHPALSVFYRATAIAEVTLHDCHTAGPGVRSNSLLVLAVPTPNHQAFVVVGVHLFTEVMYQLIKREITKRLYSFL